MNKLTSATRTDERTRYILLYYHTNKGLFNEKELRNLISFNVSKIYGLNGNVSMGLYISLTIENQPLFLIRMAQKYVNKFYVSLFFFREMNLIPIKSFGTIKSAKEFIARKNWNQLSQNL